MRADSAAARARIKEKGSSTEGAKAKYTCGDHFAAVLTVARALGFAGYFWLPLWQTPIDRHVGRSVSSLVENSGGKILASGSPDGTVNRNGSAGEPLASLQGYTGDVYSVAWSPDGKTLATGSDDPTVKLCEAATGKLLADLPGICVGSTTSHFMAFHSPGLTERL